MFYEVRDITLDYSKIDAPDTGYVPKLKVFVPNTESEVSKFTPNRPTVLVIPGGGYGFVSEREAEPIALRFVARGMNACVLYYSVAPAVFPVSLLEALTAVKYIRDNAEKYNADKDKIYVCGFSAGGHLAASVGTLWNKKESREYFGNTDCVRPNGLILSYPVIINDGPCHRGSFDNLLGDRRNDEQMLEYVCLDKQVSGLTPPTFLWSTFEDTLVPCESTLRFASALRANGVPFELHIYEKGWHGMSTGDLVTNECVVRLKNWLDEACDWVLDTRSAYMN